MRKPFSTLKIVRVDCRTGTVVSEHGHFYTNRGASRRCTKLAGQPGADKSRPYQVTLR
jgi:hypothetical protein